MEYNPAPIPRMAGPPSVAGDNDRSTVAVYGILVPPADAAAVRVIADALISRFRWRGDAEQMNGAATMAARLLEDIEAWMP